MLDEDLKDSDSIPSSANDCGTLGKSLYFSVPPFLLSKTWIMMLNRVFEALRDMDENSYISARWCSDAITI